MCSSSLIQHYPNFNAHVRDSLRELVGEEVEKKVNMVSQVLTPLRQETRS